MVCLRRAPSQHAVGRAAPLAVRAAVAAAALTALAACAAAGHADAGGSTPANETDAVQSDAAPSGPELVLTFADFDAATRSIIAGASVQGLVEEGGACTLRVSPGAGGQVLTAETTAEAGPSGTDCGALSVALPDGATGTWKVEVGYASRRTQVSSSPGEVQVP